MLSEADRIELLALRRRAYASSEGALTPQEQARLERLTLADREVSAPRTVRPAAPAGGAEGAAITAPSREDEDTPVHTPEAHAEPAPRRGARWIRPLVAGAAALALVVGGWAAGRVSAPGAAVPDPLLTTIEALSQAHDWAPSSFAVIGMADGTVYAGGVVSDGTQACVVAAPIGSTSIVPGSCVAALAGSQTDLASSVLIDSASGLRSTWTFSTQVRRDTLAPATSAFTLDPANLIVTDDVRGVAASVLPWDAEPHEIGVVGTVHVWAGTILDGTDVCVVFETDADHRVSCSSADAAEIDVTEDARAFDPVFADTSVVIAVAPEGTLAPAAEFELRLEPTP